MKEGQPSPDYEVAAEFLIDEETIDEKELNLIETMIPDIIRTILNDKVTEEE